ncbi:hypothetical protein LTR10_015609 [Elasticomyces elasticus]|uniref:DUF2423 domain-containing protein n=1 Tax=Exophiala sideris TaxID=1016849 RepID=A0ABR0JLD6_9EURO|nr:hypothetical protein LTR10_015609 [Elasticomyces elasticus]KAK5036319.1 hypothetical protein LTS07_002045 [Exophiala sideris]KAK5041850.1 hypothetical protein LTR13_002517 [Exophiala sideris]KAK5066702.1 hypothetical protein LTR69_002049 [Exophiala sideris]KAK5184760.1 hypothetical protein LTR44_002606 [Eurotiomycetes sp. CCFEE 6388]
MAKSARASDTKKNHRNLRKKVFGPAHDARTARLSAKLQELAAKPRVNEDKIMEVDSTPQEEGGEQITNGGSEEMELDGEGVSMKSSKSRSDKARASRKAHKVSKRKPRNSMVFASERARKAKMVSKKSKR